MPLDVHSSAHIFEDPPAVNISGFSRTTLMRGSLPDNDYHHSPSKSQPSLQHGYQSPSPLGERHINSPPQTRKIPLNKEDAHRPPMHKKSSSSTSLKTLLRGKDRTVDGNTTAAATASSPPKKTRTSTNLGGLLKKKSKKDLQDDVQDMPASSRSPFKEKGTDQRIPMNAKCLQEQTANALAQIQNGETVEERVSTYGSKDEIAHENDGKSVEYLQSGQFFSLESPKRPFLEHKSSRSSIFTEDLDENEKSNAFQKSKMSEDYLPGARSVHVSPAKSSERETQPDLSKNHSGKAKRSSKIFDTIAALNMRSRREDQSAHSQEEKTSLSPQELDSAMEKMLGRYDVPQNLRDQLRNLKPEVKAGLMKGDRIGSGSSDKSLHETGRARSGEGGRPVSAGDDNKDGKRSRSRSRTRSRILSLSKRGDGSPSKNDTSGRSSSKSRPKSMDISWSTSSKGLSSTASLANMNTSNSTVTPGDFIHYLGEVQRPELVEVGKIHKLRILLRNESVAWTDAFVKKGGMDEIVQLLYRIMNIEWREEHEDNLLHETLLCLKGLSTTKLAMQSLKVIGVELFPALLKMLFDPERKGPAEYGTRGIIISLIFSHLSATLYGSLLEHEQRARCILSMMRDPEPIDDRQPLDFVSQMHISRPYRTWCKEVTNVTKEVFWIFLHHMNVIPIGGPASPNEIEHTRAYFPCLRAPHPAAPYVGGVEWEATQYLALHLDLLNGLIISLPTIKERNILREEFKQSGWEKVMGASLRTCKEKFYGGVHDGLKAWVAAAKKDGWPVEDVRAGPPREPTSPKKSPVKKGKQNEAPKISLDVGDVKPTSDDNGWL